MTISINKHINMCNIFILAYCGRVAITAYEANRYSALLLGVVIAISLYYFIYANRYYHLPKFMKILNVLICILSIYGIFHIMFDPPVKDISGNLENKSLYLQTALESLLPIYAFYVFTRKGQLTLEKIKFLIPFFIALSIFQFTQMHQKRLLLAILKGSSQEEFTNNTGYIFVSLLPLLALPFKRKWLQYLFWGICIVYVLIAVKRGAILITGISVIFFLWYSMKTASLKNKWKIVMLSVVLLAVGCLALMKQLESSTYFQNRLESTRKGDLNGREMVYTPIINNFFDDTGIVGVLIGKGANSTIPITGFRAHNDWLQFLSDQGILGVILYLIYFICLYHLWKRNKKDQVVGITIGLFFLINFLRTLFSMSYADYSMYATMAIGYSVAYLDNKKINKNICYENCNTLSER